MTKAFDRFLMARFSLIALLGLAAAAGCGDSDSPAGGLDGGGGSGGSDAGANTDRSVTSDTTGSAESADRGADADAGSDAGSDTEGDVTTSDGGGSGDGGGGAKIPVPPGEPVTAPAMTWTAVPVAGTLCRNSQMAGFGININPSADKLLIWLDGGGACFNGVTCSQNSSGWAVTNDNLNNSVKNNTVFSRATDTNNPFKDWHMVYVPYCTGDVHSGANMSGQNGQPQMGQANFFKYLQRIIATFTGLKEVVLSGSSAGGFGATWNWMLTQDAFGDVPVSLLDDSGPPMAPEYLSECLQVRVGKLWSWDKTAHPACGGCDAAAGKVVRPLVDTALARARTRYALLSYDEDGTIKNFFAFGQDNCAGIDAFLPPATAPGKFPMGLAELGRHWMSSSHASLYVFKGAGHTFLRGDLSKIQTGTGPNMLDWVKKFLDKSDPWTNVFPAP